MASLAALAAVGLVSCNGLADLYGKIKEPADPGAKAILDLANLRLDASTTPLAWDIAKTHSDGLDSERDIVVDPAAAPTSWSPTSTTSSFAAKDRRSRARSGLYACGVLGRIAVFVVMPMNRKLNVSSIAAPATTPQPAT